MGEFTRESAPEGGYGYRTRMVVDIYFRARDNPEAFHLQSSLAEAFDERLAEMPLVDGGNVVERMLYAEWSQRR